VTAGKQPRIWQPVATKRRGETAAEEGGEKENNSTATTATRGRGRGRNGEPREGPGNKGEGGGGGGGETEAEGEEKDRRTEGKGTERAPRVRKHQRTARGTGRMQRLSGMHNNGRCVVISNSPSSVPLPGRKQRGRSLRAGAARSKRRVKRKPEGDHRHSHRHHHHRRRRDSSTKPAVMAQCAPLPL